MPEPKENTKKDKQSEAKYADITNFTMMMAIAVPIIATIFVPKIITIIRKDKVAPKIPAS